jgi:hypothetical protein
MAGSVSQQDSDASKAHPHRKDNSNWLLYSGIKNLLRCDAAETVEEIARYVISQHPALRVVSRFVERTRRTPIPALLTLLAWTRSFLVVRAEGRLTGVAWIARLSNERRALEPFIASSPELNYTELKFESRISIGDAFRLTLQNLRFIPRVYRIARRMHRSFDAFKVMRVIELLGYYARYVELFKKADFDVALTSNHSNPHGIAFNLAARKCGIPVVLIAHGMPVRPVARLKYDLAVVHCDAASQTYLDEGCRIDRILIQGRKQDHVRMRAAPLPAKINAGIFLCKDVNEQRLKALVNNLLANERVSHVVIRPHPKNLWVQIDSWIGSYEDGRLYKSRPGAALEDVKALDVVFGGNSSVLIDAVTTGVPSAYVDQLDHGSADLHGFVAAGLIYHSEVDPDFDELLRFYQQPEWEQKLRSFANIDDDAATVIAKTLTAIAGMSKR